jgi:hypothetical protein
VSSAIDEPQMIALHVHLQVSITVAAAITTIPPTVQAEFGSRADLPSRTGGGTPRRVLASEQLVPACMGSTAPGPREMIP